MQGCGGCRSRVHAGAAVLRRSGPRLILAEAGKLVIIFGFFRQKIEDADIFRIHEAGFGIALLDTVQTLPAFCQNFFALAEEHGSRGAGFHAHGLKSCGNAVYAHVALCQHLGLFVVPGNVVRTGLDDRFNVGRSKLGAFFRDEHGTGGLVLNHGTGNGQIGEIHADGGQAVAALVGEEVPHHIARIVEMLVEADDFKVVGIEIRGILMGAPLLGDVGGQVVPLLACQLAAAAGRAPCCVYKKCFRHRVLLEGRAAKARPA